MDSETRRHLVEKLCWELNQSEVQVTKNEDDDFGMWCKIAAVAACRATSGIRLKIKLNVPPHDCWGVQPEPNILTIRENCDAAVTLSDEQLEKIDFSKPRLPGNPITLFLAVNATHFRLVIRHRDSQ